MQKSKYTMVSLHVLVWGAVLVLPYLLITPHSRYGNTLCNYFTLSNLIHIGLFYLNAFYLYSNFFTRRRWWIYILAVAILILGVYNLKLWMIDNWFPSLLNMPSILRFTFSPIPFCLVISTLYALVMDKFQSEKIQLSAELRFLRSQISPHFLFNVHNSLVSMARHKSDQLEPALIKLSGLMRYMLHEATVDKVPLATEVDYLESYIQLQKIRFADHIDIQTSLAYESNGEYIEPMLLIPLVENAFKHGVADVEAPFISIQLKMNDGILSFDVKNRYSTETGSKDSHSGIGLENLKARLQLLYRRHHTFVTNTDNGVYHSRLTLKLR